MYNLVLIFALIYNILNIFHVICYDIFYNNYDLKFVYNILLSNIIYLAIPCWMSELFSILIIINNISTVFSKLFYVRNPLTVQRLDPCLPPRQELGVQSWLGH